MNEKEFSDKYIQEIPMFEAWGDFVLSRILSSLPNNFEKQCIKIEPAFRTKALDSILIKAFVTKKRKYDEITDKIGMRFVVLLVDHISTIKNVIEQNTNHWHASEDRELEDWRRTNTPNSFGYQSVHYILYAAKDIVHNKVIIKKDTPCEVQIRTLLQHAYAEMAHDNTYKTDKAIPKEVYRYLAKSMALMETTDEILSQANKCILDNNKVINDWRYLIAKHAKENLTTISSYGTNYILDQLRELLIDTAKYKKHSLENFSQYIQKNPHVIRAIKERSAFIIGFREETILVVFYLSSLYRRKIRKIELFDEETVMKNVYSILGFSYSDTT